MARQLAAPHGAEPAWCWRRAAAKSSMPWPRSAGHWARRRWCVRHERVRRSRNAARWWTRPCSSSAASTRWSTTPASRPRPCSRRSRPQDLHWYEKLMKVNLWGGVWCTHAALPHLKASRGRIVAVSSLAGLVGVPGRTAYSATKFAMTGFFEALRAELKSAGVSVTTAYPGVVATSIRHRGYNARGEPAGCQRPEGRRRDERGGMRPAHHRRHERAPARGGDDGQGQARPLRQAHRAGHGRRTWRWRRSRTK